MSEMGESALIERWFAPLAAGYPGALGLRDDCAVMVPPSGCDLVVTVDAVVAGVHFLPLANPYDIAWKALAANVSDLVAKGATPYAYVMALAVPGLPSDAWFAAFTEGLAKAQETFGCHLAGGDTDRTPGPLSVTITAFGMVPEGRMVRRSGAKSGDAVFVTGTIGDAGLGLRLLRSPELEQHWRLSRDQAEDLRRRQCRPWPVCGFGDVLREFASAGMDISDGLVADFAHLCRASDVGGRLRLDAIPVSAAAHKAMESLGSERDARVALATSGEDYELLLTVPEARAEAFGQAAGAHGTRVTRIGVIADRDVVVVDLLGAVVDVARPGFDHFA